MPYTRLEQIQSLAAARKQQGAMRDCAVEYVRAKWSRPQGVGTPAASYAKTEHWC